MKHNTLRTAASLTACLLSAVIVICGCQKDKLDPADASASAAVTEGDFELTIEVNYEPRTKTNISLDAANNKLPVLWNEDDTLYVAGATDGYLGFLTNTETTSKATAKFKGNVKGWSTAQDIHVYYLGKFKTKPTFTDNQFTFDISNQGGTLAAIADSGHIAHAVSEDVPAGTHTISDDLTLTNLNAVILYDLSAWTSGVEISGTYNSATLDLKTGAFKSDGYTTGDISLASDNCTATTYMTFIPDNKALTFTKGIAYTPTRANNVEAGRFYSDAGKAIKVPYVCQDGYIEHNRNWGPGIEIDGVIWAPVNCGIWDGEYPYGKLYQWGRKYGQSNSSSVTPEFITTQASTMAEGSDLDKKDKFYTGFQCWFSGNTINDTWLSTYNPCPVGWRVPTEAELTNLYNSTRTWTTEPTTGYLFGTSPNQVFFPSVGQRRYSDGVIISAATCGYYWSSAPNIDWAGSARYLYFNSDNANIGQDYRAYGCSVRCVKEIVQEIEWIDLDLPSGNLWANMNIGATAPEDYGNFYAWGELETKEEYSWATYKFGNGVENYLTKYNTTDRVSSLALSDDVASVTLGDGARIPTYSQWQELKSNCTLTWETLNEIEGYKVTSKVNPSKSIFLPVGGQMNGKTLVVSDEGQYWACDLWTNVEYDNYWQNAYRFSFSKTTWGMYDLRVYGKAVRAVKENN